MASHVVVVDTAARTARIKTTPAKHLTEVLSEACAKFNLNPDNFTLKYNNKPVDLSRTIRLANLPPGAKLDLVQGSRSPSVVNIALQLEQQRLTHKFPSDTSLWQVLRVFETVSEKNLNLTQRGVAVTSSGGSGSGRLNYEMPIFNIMGKEVGTFTDLQKTLAQHGLTGGSQLLRCSFRDSGKSLEDAMTEISGYFKSAETPEATKETQGAHTNNAGTSAAAPETPTPAAPDNAAFEPNPPEPSASAMEDVIPTSQEDTTPAPAPAAEAAPASEPDAPSSDTVTGPDQRPMIIYTPSTSTTPAAVRNTAFNEEDYVPTIDHAKSHQALLQNAGKNKRLASDAELAAAEQAKAEKLAAIEGVTIRVRLPDTSHVEARFGKQETTAALYACVRGVLAYPDQPFTLKYPGARGLLVTLNEDKAKRLVADLGFQGRQLMNLVWEDGASGAARTSRSLKQEWYAKGHEMTVKEPPAASVSDEKATKTKAGSENAPPAKKQASSGDKESKLKAMLNKGLFKGRK
ncbi:Tether containing UBX domain for GLUT4 [Lasiodiplodia hormozganensis]|uniref:Tether containing UBX domain for GLUT4 n=1 Tax=Lasiodiplodia hormozganensis TaxID=869390 RepID=A0AA39YVX1_9PEZI|nr:Tether containing UBX domain for GLUT4 [Lasiodiplodia hormozganensis]